MDLRVGGPAGALSMAPGHIGAWSRLDELDGSGNVRVATT